VTLRVVVADDHPVFRQGIRALLAAVPDVEVVAEATGGEEAVRLAVELRPDVVVMDLNMPGLNGVDATRRVAREAPEVGVLVLTMFEDDDSVFAAMRAGARGYLVKGADSPEVLRAISAVAGGEAIFGPSVAGRVLGYLTRPLSAQDERVFPTLTSREREILSLMAAGQTNNRIATSLSLSAKTVRNNVSSIFTKLQVADRAEAIVRARRAGLGVDDGEQA
jgi:DNA-binding NarL/FixJ family response regulator